MISTVDPEARHAHKTRERRQDGFKAHLVVEPDTGLITAGGVTKATGPDNSDAAVGAGCWPPTPPSPGPDEPTGRTIERSRAVGLEVLGDSAYGTGDALAALHDAGHTPMIKPWPPRPAVEGGFTIDDFTVDEDAGTVTCPNQVTRPISSNRNGHLRRRLRRLPAPGPLHHLPRPDAAHPASRHDALQRAHRARASTPAFQTVYRRHRPMVERSIAWLDPRQPAGALPRRRPRTTPGWSPRRRDQPPTPPRPRPPP